MALRQELLARVLEADQFGLDRLDRFVELGLSFTQLVLRCNSWACSRQRARKKASTSSARSPVIVAAHAHAEQVAVASTQHTVSGVPATGTRTGGTA
jgi:hypothetical protein